MKLLDKKSRPGRNPKTGEEVISIDDVYGGSRRLFDKVFFKNFKVKYTYLNFDKL